MDFIFTEIKTENFTNQKNTEKKFTGQKKREKPNSARNILVCEIWF